MKITYSLPLSLLTLVGLSAFSSAQSWTAHDFGFGGAQSISNDGQSTGYFDSNFDNVVFTNLNPSSEILIGNQDQVDGMSQNTGTTILGYSGYWKYNGSGYDYTALVNAYTNTVSDDGAFVGGSDQSNGAAAYWSTQPSSSVNDINATHYGQVQGFDGNSVIGTDATNDTLFSYDRGSSTLTQFGTQYSYINGVSNGTYIGSIPDGSTNSITGYFTGPSAADFNALTTGNLSGSANAYHIAGDYIIGQIGFDYVMWSGPNYSNLIDLSTTLAVNGYHNLAVNGVNDHGDLAGWATNSNGQQEYMVWTNTQAAPEPVSIAVLALGALGVLKRKRA